MVLGDDFWEQAGERHQTQAAPRGDRGRVHLGAGSIS
jgi:hypothetical protein